MFGIKRAAFATADLPFSERRRLKMREGQGKGQGVTAKQIGEWAENNPLDAAALATAPVLVLGDVVGAAADTKAFADDPSWTNAAMLAAGLLPFVPAGSVKRVGEGLLDATKKADDLPMDEASRMQRALDMGMDKNLYHGTHSDVTEVDPDKVDLGMHLGSAEQANNRLKSLANPLTAGRSGALRAGANVMPLKARIENPLELKDIGLWNNSMDVASELNRKGLISDDLYGEISDVRYSYEDLEDFIDGPENREFLDEIKSTLQEQGYDGIKYKNEVENEYGNLSSMTDEAKDLRRYYNDKLQKIELNVSDRMPTPPDPSDPNAAALLDEFLAAPRDWKSYATSEELAEWEDAAGKFRAIDEDPASFVDPHSYIAFEPSQVRSRFAKFDPSKADSADLLAGVAGLGLMGVLGSQLIGDDERQY